IQKLGFGKTFYGRSCHASYFLEKMHAIRAHCGASARFVVIGYGRGADAAQQLTRNAAETGTNVDRVICLEPRHELVDDGDSGAFVTIRAAELIDVDSPETESGKAHAVDKSDLPTHPKVLSIIERELTMVAMTVPPPPRPDFPKVLLVPAVPAPRDTPANPQPLSEDWQFLRPREPWERPA